MDFSLSPELQGLRDRVAAFVRAEVIPRERETLRAAHGPSDDLRRELVAAARRAGLLSPHAPRELGGLGLDHRGQAIVFEAASYSTLGGLALNIQAPDEGNLNLLLKVGSEEQRDRWARPLAAGEIRTVFCMTEPDGGAGSDPALMRTTAREAGDEWVIAGRKWLITGLPGSSLAIIMARAIDREGEELGATMFIAPADAPGLRMARMLDTMDSNCPGGHCELLIEDLRVPRGAVLGAVGEGFRYAQVRLGPARLTHCMRWLGLAQRCQDIALDYAGRRTAFGSVLGRHQGVGFQLADSDADLHACRLLTWHCAWLLDQGLPARHETSRCKVMCSEALGRVVDRSVQILGGLGITADTVVEQIYRDIRGFRIFDGPSEVHRHVLARNLLRGDAAGA